MFDFQYLLVLHFFFQLEYVDGKIMGYFIIIVFTLCIKKPVKM